MIHFNANGMSILTVADRELLTRGHDPGDDGSGRRFHVVDDTRLCMTVPTELHPIELAWFGDGSEPADIGAPDIGADGEILSAEQTILELRAQVAEHAETIDRIMAQRDAAIAEAAELRALVATATAPTAPDAPEDLIGTPDPD